jgi:hypothetical protein
VAHTLLELGIANRGQAHYGDAEKFLYRALAAYEQVDSRDPALALTINALAAVYDEQRQVGAALPPRADEVIE